MMMAVSKSFGSLLRREREAKEIGLREMAKKIGISPTYLSKVERDEFSPPAEDKVRKIAEIIGRDPDELLALAGRGGVRLNRHHTRAASGNGRLPPSGKGADGGGHGSSGAAGAEGEGKVGVGP
jgi:hypothetical protein